MITVSADINSLGNPTIFKNPLGSEVTIAKTAANVVITITPSTGYNSTNTLSANITVDNALEAIGLQVYYQPTVIVISYTTPLVNTVLTSFLFIIKDGSNVTTDTVPLSIEILEPEFTVTQVPCGYCTSFDPTETKTTSNNPPIANRGKMEYNFTDALGVESLLLSSTFNTTVNYCWCGAATNLPVKSILTIRQIPNCGGTSPIVFQAIKPTTLIDVVEFEPTNTMLVPFSSTCCVSEDANISVTLTAIQPSNSAPHNISTDTYLKYDIYKSDNGVYNDPVIKSSLDTQLKVLKTGTISLVTNSAIVTGSGTAFTTELLKGSSLFSQTGVFIGIVLSIESNTSLTLSTVSNSTVTSITFKSNKYYYKNPTLPSSLFNFNYTDLEKGTYKVVVTYGNYCSYNTQEWIVNVCGSVIVNTGTCNNPSIQNLSSIDVVKFNLKTLGALDVTSSDYNTYVLKEQLVNKNSTLQLDKLEDGFYVLETQIIDGTTGVNKGAFKSSYLFYDCNIKSCQVGLYSTLLGYNVCVDCVDRKANDLAYEKLKTKVLMFEMNKNIIYSFWNNIKFQQSISNTWDIEDHLQEVLTYRNTLNKIKEICTDCGYDFNTGSVISSSGCGCS